LLKKYLLITLLIASLSVITGCEIMDYLPDEEKPPSGYGTLSGNVVDDLSGVGLWMGTVEIAGQVTEIEGGKFQVENIPVGPQNLLISKEFYQDQKIEVIIENQTNMIDVKMTPIFSDSDLDCCSNRCLSNWTKTTKRSVGWKMGVVLDLVIYSNQ